MAKTQQQQAMQDQTDRRDQSYAICYIKSKHASPQQGIEQRSSHPRLVIRLFDNRAVRSIASRNVTLNSYMYHSAAACAVPRPNTPPKAITSSATFTLHPPFDYGAVQSIATYLENHQESRLANEVALTPTVFHLVPLLAQQLQLKQIHSWIA